MEKKKKILKRILQIAGVLIILYAVVNIVYLLTSYHADETAQKALLSDDAVEVTKTDYGWFMDGPSEKDALIFYPGARVEVASYAPILHDVAAAGMDVFLMDMPYDLALLVPDKADEVISLYSYENRYIGGHSLGGCVAADYASKHADEVEGVIFLASYPAKAMDDRLKCISIYGSDDGVLNWSRMTKAGRYLPKNTEKYVIEGGNHGQFGNYGQQFGDKEATISDKEQQKQAAERIIEWVSDQAVIPNN